MNAAAITNQADTRCPQDLYLWRRQKWQQYLTSKLPICEVHNQRMNHYLSFAAIESESPEAYAPVCGSCNKNGSKEYDYKNIMGQMQNRKDVNEETFYQKFITEEDRILMRQHLTNYYTAVIDHIDETVRELITKYEEAKDAYNKDLKEELYDFDITKPQFKRRYRDKKLKCVPITYTRFHDFKFNYMNSLNKCLDRLKTEIPSSVSYKNIKNGICDLKNRRTIKDPQITSHFLVENQYGIYNNRSDQDQAKVATDSVMQYNNLLKIVQKQMQQILREVQIRNKGPEQQIKVLKTQIEELLQSSRIAAEDARRREQNYKKIVELLEKKCTELEYTKNAVQKELEEVSDQQKAERKLSYVQQQIYQLEDRKSRLQQEAANYERSINSVQGEIVEKENRVVGLKQQQEQAITALTKMIEEKDSTKQEIEELHKVLAKCSQEAKKLEENMTSSRFILEQAEEQIRNKKSEGETIETYIHLLNQEKEKLLVEIEEARNIKTQLSSLARQVAGLSGDRDRLRQEVASLHAERQSWLSVSSTCSDYKSVPSCVSLFKNLLLQFPQPSFLNQCFMARLDSISKIEFLFSASQHNFSNEQFHRRCDSKSHLMILCKSIQGHHFGAFVARSFTPNNKIKAMTSEQKAKTFIFGATHRFCASWKPQANQPSVYDSGYGPLVGCMDLSITGKKASTRYHSRNMSRFEQVQLAGNPNMQTYLFGSKETELADYEVYQIHQQSNC